MKRIALFLALILLLSCVSCSGGRLRSAAFVVRPDGNVTFYSPEDTVVHPASVTKLLTAICALELLPPDTEITPGDEVYLPPEGASSAYIRPNHTLTLSMLIEGMLVPSGDDAAYAVAAACGRALAGDDALDYHDAVARFVEYMNETARSLGCAGTHFTTPDGYAEDEHASTLGDMAVICRRAMEEPLILKYAALAVDDVIYLSGHTNTWVNTNLFLRPDSEVYDPDVKGLKTGSLLSNYSIVTLVEIDGEDYLIGVFGAKDNATRYRDTEAILKQLRKEIDA